MDCIYGIYGYTWSLITKLSWLSVGSKQIDILKYMYLIFLVNFHFLVFMARFDGTLYHKNEFGWLLSSRLSIDKICMKSVWPFGCAWVLVSRSKVSNLQRKSTGLFWRFGENNISFEDDFEDITFANKDDENVDALKHVQTVCKVPMVFCHHIVTNKSRNNVKGPYESHAKEEFEEQQKSIHSRMLEIDLKWF